MKAKKGDFIEITKRLVSDKVQPHIKVGNVYHINSLDKTKSGAVVLVLDRDLNKKTTIRCNAERFKWRVLTVKDLVDKNIGRKSKKVVSCLQNAFTEQEQLKMSLLPVIIFHVAWTFADQAVAYAAKNKISELIKLSRTVRMLKERYMYYLSLDLDRRHIDRITEQADEVMKDDERDFTILFHTIKNMITYNNVGIDHDELRTFAYMSILFLDKCNSYEEDRNKKIKLKLGTDSGTLPYVSDLRDCMSAILADVKLDLDNVNVKNGMRIFQNSFNQIEFREVKNEEE